MSRLGKILLFCSGLSLLGFIIVRALLGTWVPFLWVCLGLFALLFIGGIVVDRKFFSEFLSMRTTRQGMSMGAMIGLTLVLLIAVNFIAARKYTTFDFSLGRVNTLSDQSIKLVQSLEDDLKVIYFYKDGTEGVEENRRAFIELIRKYQDQSDRVKLEFVEVNRRPDLTEKYEIKKGTQAVILDYKGKTNMIEKIDEQELTSALVKVTRTTSKKVYFLTGHGELPIEQSADGQSVSLLKQLLEGNRYTVKNMSFTDTPEVPADADILMILGPQQAFLDVEVKALENFLKRGGGVVLAVEPRASHGLDGFLSQVGLKVENNYIASVLETPFGKAIDPRFTRGSEFSSASEITRPFGRGEFTLFRLPQAVRKLEKTPEGMTIEELVKTNASAMGYTTMKFDNNGASGPFALAVSVKGAFPGAEMEPVAADKKDGAAEPKPKQFNLVVLGDRDVVNDQFLYQNLNRDLVLNTVAALAKEENLISITPKEITRTEMKMTNSQLALFRLGAFALPILFFILSGVLWVRRRYA